MGFGHIEAPLLPLEVCPQRKVSHGPDFLLLEIILKALGDPADYSDDCRYEKGILEKRAIE